MKTIKSIVEGSDTPSGRRFDIAIQVFIVLSLVTFSIETLPDLSSDARWWLHIIEVATVVIFTVEYLLRLYVANRKLGYAFSFYGLIDLIAIVPFYLSLGVDLRSIRVFRMFRLFRVFKLAKYTKAMRRFQNALLISKEEIVLFLVAACIVLFIAAVGIYYFENGSQPEVFSSIFHSLWWSVCTLTTVGYGDVYPVTTGGRVFTCVVLVTGLGIIALPAGLLAAALSKARQMEEEAAEETRMSNIEPGSPANSPAE